MQLWKVYATVLCALALGLTSVQGAMSAPINKDLGDPIAMVYPGWLESTTRQQRQSYIALARRIKEARERNRGVAGVEDIRLTIKPVQSIDGQRQASHGKDLPLLMRTVESTETRVDPVIAVDYDRRFDALVVTLVATKDVDSTEELSAQNSAWFSRVLLEQLWLAVQYRTFRATEAAEDPDGVAKAMMKQVVDGDPGAHPDTEVAAIEVGLQVLSQETGGRYLRTLGGIVRAHRARSVQDMVRSVTPSEYAKLTKLFPEPATATVDRYRKRTYMTDLGICWLFGQDLDPVQRWAKLSFVPGQVKSVLR